jgi:hypothetical protein
MLVSSTMESEGPCENGFIIHMNDGRVGFTKVIPSHEFMRTIKKIVPGVWRGMHCGTFIKYLVVVDGKQVTNRGLTLYDEALQMKCRANVLRLFTRLSVDDIDFSGTRCGDCGYFVPDCECAQVFFPYEYAYKLTVVA